MQKVSTKCRTPSSPGESGAEALADLFPLFPARKIVRPPACPRKREEGDCSASVGNQAETVTQGQKEAFEVSTRNAFSSLRYVLELKRLIHDFPVSIRILPAGGS